MLEPVRTVALVDDDEDLRAAMAQTLGLAGYRVEAHAGAEAALAAIDADFAGVVVSDVRMPHMSGIEMFHRLRARDPDLPVVLVTGHGDVAMAVDALKAGAWDFLTKPFDPDVLVAAVGRAAEKRSLVLDNRRLRRLAEAPVESALVGGSPPMERLRAAIALLADAEIDVLIEGETGTGKELISRLIHRGGRRAKGAFVPVACAALPDALVDAELLGEAPAGRPPRDGLLMQAHRGTLFLDDIDRASPALQARLAQIVEERSVRPPGARAPVALDMRIVACGGEGMDGAVADGRLQAALFHRLAAVRLRVPPLRERPDDVPLLFAHLLDAGAARLRRPVPSIGDAARRRLLEHDWPGNVRELAHFADRVLLDLEGAAPVAAPTDESLADRVARFERQAIVDAVHGAGGDVVRAMAVLGLPRKTFYYKVQRHGIDLRDLRRRARPDAG